MSMRSNWTYSKCAREKWHIVRTLKSLSQISAPCWRACVEFRYRSATAKEASMCLIIVYNILFSYNITIAHVPPLFTNLLLLTAAHRDIAINRILSSAIPLQMQRRLPFLTCACVCVCCFRFGIIFFFSFSFVMFSSFMYGPRHTTHNTHGKTRHTITSTQSLLHSKVCAHFSSVVAFLSSSSLCPSFFRFSSAGSLWAQRKHNWQTSDSGLPLPSLRLWTYIASRYCSRRGLHISLPQFDHITIIQLCIFLLLFSFNVRSQNCIFESTIKKQKTKM